MINADHAATTPIRPEALEALVRAARAQPGNPSSRNAAGRAARRVLDEAREAVAALVGADADAVVFTAGGTEADNLAISGFARAARARGAPCRLAVAATEHAAVLRALEDVAREPDCSVRRLSVTPNGRVEPEALRNALVSGDAPAVTPALVSIAWANNETGVVQDVAALARVAHACGARFHADAVQAAGKVSIDVGTHGVDLLSLSGHKLGGPMGTGALVVGADVELQPLLLGGGQERGLRSGTEAVPSIAGFAEACRLAREGLDAHRRHLAALSRRFEAALSSVDPSAVVHGAGADRVPGTTYVSFPGTSAETVLIALDLAGIAAGSGAACASGALDPSHVLEAMGVREELARAAVRFSFGRTSTPGEVDEIARRLGEILPRARVGSAPASSVSP